MTPRNLTNAAARPLVVAALLLGSLTGVYAANLDQAKQQGLVCELPTGYLKTVGNVPGDVQTMVQDINAKRRAEYTRIAEENGVQPDQVGKLTAQKLGPRCK